MLYIKVKHWCIALTLNKDILKKILDCMKAAYPRDLYIIEIAECASITRQTASTYLLVLEAKGRVRLRSVGKAKMFTLASESETEEGKPPSEKPQTNKITKSLAAKKWILEQLLKKVF